MKKYTTYQKIEPRYFSLSEFLTFPVLPIVVLSGISYGILYFFGLTLTIIANVVVCLFLNAYYHGYKNATPNGGNISSKDIPSLTVFLSLLPSFLVILGVLLLADVGVYIIVLYQKTGIFYGAFFSIWAFVVFGVPCLYFLINRLRYWHTVYYQAWVFTLVRFKVVHDAELLIYIQEISFLNTHKKLLSTVPFEKRKDANSYQKLNAMSVAEKNEYLYESAIETTLQIPKNTNKLKISWYSFVEDASYVEEVDFPFHKLKFEENKYPLNVSKFLRGKKTSDIILSIRPGGIIHLYNKECTLISPTMIKAISISEEDKKALLDRYTSSNRLGKLRNRFSAWVEEIKKSGRIEKRCIIGSTLFSWKLTGEGLEGHEVLMIDTRNPFNPNETLALDTFDLRSIPFCFQFDYRNYSWLEVHLDAEKLYEVLHPILENDPQTEIEFYVAVDIEVGSVSFSVKNKGKLIDFTAWEKEIREHRWEDAKERFAKNREHENKNALLNEIYNLLGQKSYLKALELCEKSIQKQPDFALLYFYEARLMWYIHGFETCYAHEKYFLEKTAHEPYALAQIYNHYGCLLDEEKRYKDALSYFENALATYPDEHIYDANIAEMHYKLKQPKEALRYADECSKKGFSSDMIIEILENKGVII